MKGLNFSINCSMLKEYMAIEFRNINDCKFHSARTANQMTVVLLLIQFHTKQDSGQNASGNLVNGTLQWMRYHFIGIVRFLALGFNQLQVTYFPLLLQLIHKHFSGIRFALAEHHFIGFTEAWNGLLRNLQIQFEGFKRMPHSIAAMH